MNIIRVTWKNNLGGNTKDFKKESSCLRYLRKIRREHNSTSFSRYEDGKYVSYPALKMTVNIEVICN